MALLALAGVCMAVPTSLCASRLLWPGNVMRLKRADAGGVCMGGAAVANYVSMLEHQS